MGDLREWATVDIPEFSFGPALLQGLDVAGARDRLRAKLEAMRERMELDPNFRELTTEESREVSARIRKHIAQRVRESQQRTGR